jgi:hypothetical protein
LLRTVSLALLVLLAALPASADVLLTPADGGGAFVGPTEGNFTITATSSAMIYVIGPTNGVYSGYADGAAWTITATDGGAFTFSGLDADALGWNPTQVNIELMGTPSDGGAAIVADLSSPGTSILPGSLTGADLSSLTISGFGYDDGGFDMTSGFNDVTVNEVFEPATTALLALGIAGIGLVRRRR